MKHKTIIAIIISAIILVLIITRIVFSKISSEDENVFTTNQSEETIIREDINKIEEIKNEIDATADTNMYQLEEEYDGRKIIQIKPNIQYETVLAGILKNDKPKENEIEKILKNKPTKSGIWISKQSRENFLELLKNNNLSGYEINEEGYLFQTQGNNNKLNQAINSDNLYIIDISGTCYTRDEISGKIVEYPFEDMDPDQILEIFNNGNSSIFEITSNSRGKISNKEILDEIIMNLE